MTTLKKIFFCILFISFIVALIVMPTFSVSVKWHNKVSLSEEPVPIEIHEEPLKLILTHRQEVWLYSLEWCECQAIHTAINEKDLDGTPSYYAFQFKPSTFKSLGEKYGLIKKGLSDAEIMELMKSYELQREIVKNMMFDTSTKWDKQFPGCVKKLGWPPR